MLDVDEICRLVILFRDAIERTDRSKILGFEDFPRGSCADASIILGTFLQSKGHSGFTVIRGERGRWDNDTAFTHAWLSHAGGLIVDITADQFAENDGIIITEHSTWHDEFRIVDEGAAHYDGYRPNDGLRAAYHATVASTLE